MKKVFAGMILVVFAAAVVQLIRMRAREGGPRAEYPLVFYCAAGIKPPVEALVKQYEKEYGVRVQLQYGGSGTLLSNIRVARRGDLYLAADSSYTDIAAEQGLIREVLPLAYMRPVIAVQQGNPLNIRTSEDLLRDEVRVTLGNPETASIGKQTMRAFMESGHWDRLRRHVEDNGVFKPTVPEVANDIKLGAADAAVVWDATVNQYDELEAVPVPELTPYRKTISLAVLDASEQPTAALRLARYLNSRIGNKVFREMGYDAVEGDAWAEHPEITFFCGSVNRRAIEDTIRAFEQREGVTVNTVYNGCGILTGQMRTIRRDESGAGFPDVYMACDRYYLDNVEEWFQEDADVSKAAIVIAVPRGNPKNIQSLDDLARPDIRVSVGQPEQCTIGALTRIMLEKSGLYDAVMSNVVMQTASSAMLIPTVTTKSVDATIAYITDTVSESGKVEAVHIDLPFAVAVQPFSIARSSSYKHLGRRLFQAIADSRGAFESAGFTYILETDDAD